MSDPNTVLSDISSFNKEQMKHVSVAEKSVLPDADAIAKEKQEKGLLQEIQASRELRHVEVQERNNLPDAEAIQQEKAAISDAAE